MKNKTDNNDIFNKVVTILEQARSNVVRSINSNIVIAYWLIGREIMEEVQGGKERAQYGKQVIKNLSKLLNNKYGSGFSVPNLRNFRQFYQIYQDRLIRYLSGSELQFNSNQYPSGSELEKVFNPNLSWSHYRALMRVSNKKAREFYETEAAESGWNKKQLERQIHTSYYERILKNKGKKGLLPANRERVSIETLEKIHTLKSHYVLEFLNLSDTYILHENDLEQAIIDNLQLFLLELGKGFSFVARQKHIRFEEDDFYIDLVFYNYILKCFVLIDLKIGKLNHRDVGQMDGYVRLFEDRFKIDGDNPTIGIILCSDKSEAVAKYSILKEGKQIFSSKYLKFLPSEQELKLKIEKERRLIESVKKE